MYGRIWFLLTFAALEKIGDILMKVSAIRIFTFVVAMGLSLCVMAQNTNQENPKRITNTNDGDSDAFKVYFSVKQNNGEIVYKKLGIEDNKTYIIDINGKKYTTFIKENMGGGWALP